MGEFGAGEIFLTEMFYFFILATRDKMTNASDIAVEAPLFSNLGADIVMQFLFSWNESINSQIQR